MILNNLLQEHCSSPGNKYKFFRKCSEEALHQDNSRRHIIFDFVEKVLLQRLIRQPGQLYFITGLKFDLFGVHDSNVSTTSIHCRPESH